MSLQTALAAEHVFLGVRAGAKPELIVEIARRIESAGGPPATLVVSALQAREVLGSTGVGNGIAVPHAALPGLAAPLAYLVQLARPVPFAAIDGQAVDLLFVLLTPPAERAEHLALLAAGTRRVREPAVAAALRAVASKAAAHALLVG
jgi:PTS system nitrogen regulatory IIA component